MTCMYLCNKDTSDLSYIVFLTFSVKFFILTIAVATSRLDFILRVWCVLLIRWLSKAKSIFTLYFNATGRQSADMTELRSCVSGEHQNYFSVKTVLKYISLCYKSIKVVLKGFSEVFKNLCQCCGVLGIQFKVKYQNQ